MSIQSPDAHRRNPEGTSARVAGIESLQATYPWVDIVDLRIYLEGFEAGERCGMLRFPENPHINGLQSHSQTKSYRRCIHYTAQSKPR